MDSDHHPEKATKDKEMLFFFFFTDVLVSNYTHADAQPSVFHDAVQIIIIFFPD